MRTDNNIDPSVFTIATSTLEILINTALRHDPASRQRLETFNGILAVELTCPQLTFYIQTHDHHITVMAYCESDISTTLKGSPLALLGLLKQPSNLKNSGVSVSGDTLLLSQWQNLIQQLDIDWEDAISHYLGDIMGPLASSGLHKSTQWAQQQWNDKQRLVSEYLVEELKLIPSRSELEYFYQHVDQLALDSERMIAKANALINTIQAHTSA